MQAARDLPKVWAEVAQLGRDVEQRRQGERPLAECRVRHLELGKVDPHGAAAGL